MPVAPADSAQRRAFLLRHENSKKFSPTYVGSVFSTYSVGNIIGVLDSKMSRPQLA